MQHMRAQIFKLKLYEFQTNFIELTKNDVIFITFELAKFNEIINEKMMKLTQKSC